MDLGAVLGANNVLNDLRNEEIAHQTSSIVSTCLSLFPYINKQNPSFYYLDPDTPLPPGVIVVWVVASIFSG
jgi:hypothetical protein